MCKIDTHNKQEAHSEADAIQLGPSFDNFYTIFKIYSDRDKSVICYSFGSSVLNLRCLTVLAVSGLFLGNCFMPEMPESS